MGTVSILNGVWYAHRRGLRVSLALAAAAVLVLLGSCREVAVTAVDVFQVTVEPTAGQVTVGQTFQLQARITDVSGRSLSRSVAWSSSSPSVAAVNGSGLVTGMGAGTATVTATVEGKSGQAVLNVNPKPVGSLEVVPDAVSLQAGDSARLQLVVKATDGSVLTGRSATWTSSDTRIAVVRPDGTVLGNAVGVTLVTAFVEGFSAQATVSVRASSGLVVANVRIQPANATLSAGDSLRLQAVLTDSNGIPLTGRLVTWTSANTAVATVDGSGLVRAVSAGTAAITATSEGVSGVAQLTVTAARPVAIEVTPASSSLTIGASIQLSATVRASDGSVLSGIPITWSSLQPTLATVDTNGLVTGLSIGTATIRAAAAGLTGDANVVVALQPVLSVSLSPVAPVVPVLDTLVLSADLKDANGASLNSRPVQWLSGDPAVASVVQTGPTTQQAWLIGVSPGTVIVTAQSEGKADTVTATVLPKANLQVTKSAGAPVVSAGDTIVFTVTTTNAGPNDASGVVVTDTLPANGTYVDATGQPSLSGRVLTWPVLPTLAVGATRLDTVRVVAPATGTVTNIAAAVSSTIERDSSDNRAQAATGVNELVDLVATKSAPATTDAGDTITYAIEVRNLGPSAATSVVVTDTLPVNAKFIDASPAATAQGNVLTWPTTASLASGSALAYTVRVVAPNSGSITNVGAATTATNEGITANNRSAATTAVRAADLAVAKLGPASAAAGDTLVYSITVTNNGPDAAVGVIVTDTLPANATFVDATGNPSQAGGVLTWSGAGLASGGSVSVTVRVRAPLAGGTVTNGAGAKSVTTDPDLTNNASVVNTAVSAATDIQVTKTGPASVNAGQTFVDTVKVRNLGPSPAANVVVTDTLPSNAVFVAASGTPAQAGNVLVWPTITSLANGDSATFLVTLRAPATTATVTNVGAAVTSTPESSSANNRGSAVTGVGAIADLSVIKTGPASVTALQTFVDTVKVKNLGPSPAANVVVTDTLPANATFITASGTPTQAGDVLTWPGIASLAAGDSATYTVTLQAPATAGSVTNVATAGTSTPEASGSNNLGSVTTSVGSAADLAVTKLGPAAVSAAQTFVDTVKVKNLGPSAAADVVVTDTLPANATFITASGTPTQAGNVLTWPAISNLAVGDSAVYTVTLQASASGGGVINVAAATSSTPDPISSNNRGTATTGVGSAADLTVSKSAPGSVDAGSPIQYVVTLQNLGPSTASGVILTDTLPPGVGFVGASGGGTLTNNVVTWPTTSLANGASLQETVTITAPAAGTVVNLAAATSAVTDPVPGNNAGAAATTVNPADLAVAKTGPATVLPGGVAAYAVSLTNQGPGRALNIVLTDTLPAAATLVSATPGYTQNGNVLAWSISSLDPGPAINYSITVTAPATGTITNAVAVTAATADPDASDDYDTASTAILQPDLAVSKVGPPSVNALQTFVDTVKVKNVGLSAAANVVVTDTLPSNATFIGASGAPTQAGSVLTWPTVASLAAGDSVVFEVTLQAPGTAGGITNVAIATTSTPEVTTANNKGTAVTGVGAVADLGVSKTGPATVDVNQAFVDTVKVRNAGPSAAANIVVTDTLPLNATFVGATGSPAQAGNVLTWPPIASLAAGDSVVFEVTLQAPGTAGSVTNTAAAVSPTTDPNPGDNAGSVTTTVTAPLPSADLAVSKTGPVTANASDTLVYTVTASNNGPDGATDVVVSDTLPTNATFVDATGSPALVGNVLTWPTVASLANGGTVVHTVRVEAPAAGGTVTNVAAAASSTADPNGSDNVDGLVTTVSPPSADLGVSKTGPASAIAGTQFTYTVQVENQGPSAAADVVITDVLPATGTYVTASDGGLESGGVVTWPTIASLPSGQGVTYTVTYTAPLTGSLTNTANVTSATADPTATNNTSSAVTAITDAADLAVTKTGPGTASVGDVLDYTIEVLNKGPSPAVDVLVTDLLPGNADYVPASASDGGVESGGVVTWPIIPSLASGASVVYTLQVKTRNPSNVTNTASATSSTGDPNTANDTSSVTTSMSLPSPAADLAVSLQATPVSVTVGDTIYYTLEVTNNGPDAADGVELTQTLAANVAFEAATGTPAQAGSLLTWTIGSMASGATEAFTVKVTATGTGSADSSAAATTTTVDFDATNDTANVSTTVT